MTASSEHDRPRSASADEPRSEHAGRLAGAGGPEHDELRRTFARRIDCAVHEGRGEAPRGGRRKPTRGGGRGAGDDHAA